MTSLHSLPRATLFVVALCPAIALAQPPREPSAIQVEGAAVVAQDFTTTIIPATIPKSGELKLPRLTGVLKSITWHDAAGKELDLQAGTLSLRSEPKFWRIVWENAPLGSHSIECRWDNPTRLFESAQVIIPDASNRFTLPAYRAEVHGLSLRFEPQSFKNTVGYWTKLEDTATWLIDVQQPGTYHFAGLIGCGENQGGSKASVDVRPLGESTLSDRLKLEFYVSETGHFQNFRWQPLGQLELATGTYEVTVGAIQIAKSALMDLRELSIVRQAK